MRGNIVEFKVFYAAWIAQVASGNRNKRRQVRRIVRSAG